MHTIRKQTMYRKCIKVNSLLPTIWVRKRQSLKTEKLKEMLHTNCITAYSHVCNSEQECSRKSSGSMYVQQF